MLARVQSARPVGCGSSARASSGAFLGQHSHGTQFMALLLQVIVLCIDGGVLRRLGKQIARVRFFSTLIHGAGLVTIHAQRGMRRGFSMRRPSPGEGPSLVSGEAYQYQLRHIRQNLDPGDALAAERAISDLAKNADDAWSLLAVCAVTAPLPHSVEVIDRSTFVAWLMAPEQKNHPMAGRRARSSGGAPAAGTPKGRSRSLPGRRALAQAQPSGAASLPDVTALDPKKVSRRPGRLAAARAQHPQPHSPRNPQPPQV